MNVVFLGGGNMANAIIGGLLAAGEPCSISVVEPLEAARRALADRFAVRAVTAPEASIAHADLYVLAVKPQYLREACASLAPYVDGALVLSVAAGIRCREISAWLGGHPRIVRSMPNTPALIQKGISGAFAPSTVSPQDRALCARLLMTLGEVVWVDRETLLDAVTAVSGSGPAYVFYAIEALEQAAIDLGLPPADARKLALHTFWGASALALQSPDDPATLRAKVTSKGGTTAAALAHMQAHELAGIWVASTKAAAARAAEMGDEFAK